MLERFLGPFEQNRGSLSVLEKAIGEDIDTPADQEPLALTPISKPEGGTERMLYHIAFDPSHEHHPLNTFSQTIFNHKGSIPPEEITSLSPNINLTKVLQGNHETDPDGNFTVPAIRSLFQKSHDGNRAGETLIIDGSVGKVLQLKRIP